MSDLSVAGSQFTGCVLQRPRFCQFDRTWFSNSRKTIRRLRPPTHSMAPPHLASIKLGEFGQASCEFGHHVKSSRIGSEVPRLKMRPSEDPASELGHHSNRHVRGAVLDMANKNTTTTTNTNNNYDNNNDAFIEFNSTVTESV